MKGIGEEFWTATGVRQGCPLSPLWFRILIAELEKEIGKGRWGRVKVGGEKIYTVAYADDIGIVAEEEWEMKCMLKKLEGYLEKKGLVPWR